MDVREEVGEEVRCDPSDPIARKCPIIFDRARIGKYRNKIKTLPLSSPLNASIELLIQRLSYLKGSFQHVAEIGTMSPDLSLAMWKQYTDIQTYTRFGLAPTTQEDSHTFIVGDEEGPLPFQKASLDLVLGHFSWHSLNDLPGFLSKIYGFLGQSGVMAALLIGGESLFELHHVLSSVYWKKKNGFTPIIAPMIQPSSMSSLLQNAGFQQPVVSIERVTLLYTHLLSLLKDIQYFGGQASLLNSDFVLTPGIVKESQILYQETFGKVDGKLPLTLDVLFISGSREGERLY